MYQLPRERNEQSEQNFIQTRIAQKMHVGLLIDTASSILPLLPLLSRKYIRFIVSNYSKIVNVGICEIQIILNSYFLEVQFICVILLLFKCTNVHAKFILLC